MSFLFSASRKSTTTPEPTWHRFKCIVRSRDWGLLSQADRILSCSFLNGTGHTELHWKQRPYFQYPHAQVNSKIFKRPPGTQFEIGGKGSLTEPLGLSCLGLGPHIPDDVFDHGWFFFFFWRWSTELNRSTTYTNWPVWANCSWKKQVIQILHNSNTMCPPRETPGSIWRAKWQNHKLMVVILDSESYKLLWGWKIGMCTWVYCLNSGVWCDPWGPKYGTIKKALNRSKNFSASSLAQLHP